jgi:hypothetical protein
MEILNPIAGALAQSAAVTRQQSADKVRHIRHAQALRKDVAAAEDTFEHHVESAEELSAIHDEQREPERERQRKPHTPPTEGDEPPPHIDVVA